MDKTYINQTQLAKFAGVSLTTVKNWFIDGLPKSKKGILVSDALGWLAQQRQLKQVSKSDNEISLKEQKQIEKYEQEIKKLELANKEKEKGLVNIEVVKDGLLLICQTLKTKLEKVGEKHGCTKDLITAIEETEKAIQDKEIQTE